MAIASATKGIALLEDLKGAQDVIKCDLCANSVELQCNKCDVKLCGHCVSRHVSKTPTTHEIVTFVHRKSGPVLPVCQFHRNAKCELKCQTCNIAVCSKCITTFHKFHDFEDLMEVFKSKLDLIQQDTNDLEMEFVPRYQNIISRMKLRLSTLAPEYQILKSAIKKHGQEVHRMVDVVIKMFEDEAEKMEQESLATLKNRISESTSLLDEIQELIKENKRLMQSSNVEQALLYNSEMDRFRKVKSEFCVSVPDFWRVKLTNDELCNLFGRLETKDDKKESSLENKEEKNPSTEEKEFLLMPRLTATTESTFEHVQRVSCHDTSEAWVSGNQKNIIRIDLDGNAKEVVYTSSGYVPHDLTVSKQGELLYCDSIERTANIIKSDKTRVILRYEGWRPQGICTTSEDGILVTLYNDLEGRSKVIKYGIIKRKDGENQEISSLEALQPKPEKVIQYDERGETLYKYATFIAENAVNHDICVSDHGTNTVVVVNQAGKFKFTYSNLMSQRKYDTFFPCSIATDSQGHILIADGDNDCIHVIDKDRQFLCYIDNCNFSGVCGIDVDPSDNVWVGEVDTGRVKVVQYLTD
ncbi:uncharacterized protein LOC134268257 [Saccostrea cucullata]|uniref:uncharacterized protein LOC134268257 n=1 Tax=Saccostrea cuccullata TaxID=36930 RepID=UPI002ED6AD86